MKTLLFLGDSITDCGHCFEPENLGDGYVRRIADKFSNQKETVRILNKGMDGFTVSAVSRLWKRSCLGIKPDFITLLVGINDLAILQNTGMDLAYGLKAFEKNYESLLEDIRLITDCPLLLMEPFLFPCPAEFSAWEPHLKEMCRIIEHIAYSYHVGFLPLLEKLKSAASARGYAHITTDGIHLTGEGHQILADAWQHYYLSINEADSVS